MPTAASRGTSTTCGTNYPLKRGSPRTDNFTRPFAYLGGKFNPLLLERLTCYDWRFASGRLTAALRCPCCASNGPLPDAAERDADRRLLAHGGSA